MIAALQNCEVWLKSQEFASRSGFTHQARCGIGESKMRAIKRRFLHPRGESRKSLRLVVNVAALIGVAAMGCAQEREAGSGLKGGTHNERHETPGGGAVLRRLEAVTWNPVTDELTWVVSAGSKSTGAYRPGATDTYVIHLESATMRFKDKDRRFSE